MSVLERDREHVERDGLPPRIAHFSNDPEKKVALCGTPILGVPAYSPYIRCVVCVDLRYGASEWTSG